MLKRFVFVLLIIFVFPMGVLSQELPEMPSTDSEQFSVAEWEVYTKDVLGIMFPQFDTSDIVVSIERSDLLIAQGLNNEVIFSRSLLVFLENKYEFATVLAHEYGHVREGWNTEISDEENQLIADEYILRYLPLEWAAPCVFAVFLLRFIEEVSAQEEVSIVDVARTDLKRIDLMNQVCYRQ